MILTPDLGFRQLGLAPLPNLDDIARHGAAGILNIRTVHGISIDEGFLTAGSGNRASVSFNGEIGQSLNRQETIEGSSAETIYRRRTGLNPQQYGILAVNYAQFKADSATVPYDLHPGLLGDALKLRDIAIAAIGNADIPGPPGSPPLAYHREVVGVAMDHLGRVKNGDVSEDLLERDPGSAFSVRLNIPRVMQVFRQVVPRSRVIAIEVGGLIPLQQTASLYLAAPFRDAQVRVIRQIDLLAGAVARELDFSRDLLIVCTPAVDNSNSGSPTLGFVVAAGPGITPGQWLSSASTRRAGIAVLTDIVPTVLQFFGAAPPPGNPGSPFRSEPATRQQGCGLIWRPEDPLHPIRSVRELGDLVLRFDSERNDVQRWFVYLLTAILPLAALSLVFPSCRRLPRPRSKRRSPSVKGGITHGLESWGWLVPPALPIAMLLEPFLLPSNSAEAGLEVTALVILIVLVAWRAGQPRSLVGIAGVAAALVALDLLTGQQSMMSSMLSYSPSEGARYYGIGNEYMGVLVGAATVASCRLGRRSGATRIAASVMLFVPAVLICLPGIGAKAGGALVAVPSAAAAAWALTGRRITPRVVGAFALLGLAVLAAMIVVDMRHPEASSHIGRNASGILNGGLSVAGDIISRKLWMEWRLLKYSPWSRCLIAALVSLGLLLYFRRYSWRSIREENWIRAAMAGLGTAAITSILFNDAGVVAAALIANFLPALAASALLQNDRNSTRSAGDSLRTESH